MAGRTRAVPRSGERVEEGIDQEEEIRRSDGERQALRSQHLFAVFKPRGLQGADAAGAAAGVPEEIPRADERGVSKAGENGGAAQEKAAAASDGNPLRLRHSCVRRYIM